MKRLKRLKQSESRVGTSTFNSFCSYLLQKRYSSIFVDLLEYPWSSVWYLYYIFYTSSSVCFSVSDFYSHKCIFYHSVRQIKKGDHPIFCTREWLGLPPPLGILLCQKIKCWYSINAILSARGTNSHLLSATYLRDSYLGASQSVVPIKNAFISIMFGRAQYIHKIYFPIVHSSIFVNKIRVYKTAV